MSDQDSKEILEIVKRKRYSNKENGEDPKITGIFFIDELNWTVWIDGVAYYSIGQKEGFSIDEVSENNVVLMMNDGTRRDISVE
jgi:hypothetical protein